MSLTRARTRTGVRSAQSGVHTPKDVANVAYARGQEIVPGLPRGRVKDLPRPLITPA